MYLLYCPLNFPLVHIVIKTKIKRKISLQKLFQSKNIFHHKYCIPTENPLYSYIYVCHANLLYLYRGKTLNETI